MFAQVFLPAYNESIALERLVPKFDLAFRQLNMPYHVTIVNDGSSDNTSEVVNRLAQQYPVTLVEHEKNKGLGQAMITGLKHMQSVCSPDDIIVTMDADDTHDPKFMSKGFDKLAEGFDVVIFSRYQKQSAEHGLSAFRGALSKGAAIFLKVFFPIKGVWEYSCGYRLMKATCLYKAQEKFGDQFIRFAHMGFVVTPEILVKLRMLGCRIAEVPFELYYDRKPTKSTHRPLRTIRGYFALVGAYWGRRLK